MFCVPQNREPGSRPYPTEGEGASCDRTIFCASRSHVFCSRKQARRGLRAKANVGESLTCGPHDRIIPPARSHNYAV